MQERGSVRDKQEEPYGVQGVSPSKMSDGRDVEIWVAVRPSFELVQDPLPSPGADERESERDLGRCIPVRAGFPAGIPAPGTWPAEQRDLRERREGSRLAQSRGPGSSIPLVARGDAEAGTGQRKQVAPSG